MERAMTRLHAVAGALALIACGGPSRPAETTAAELPPAGCTGELASFEHDVRPLVERYCFECHARGGSATEDHDFGRFEVLFAQRRRVGRALEAHAMPPASERQPSALERALLVRWASCSGPSAG
jgi:uncharacterized membrane protein